MSAGVVIVGAGQAGHSVAEALRKEGFEAPITLLGEEPHAPYQRPPLSKSYLLGETDAQRLHFRAKNYYDEHQIDLRVNTQVGSIDTVDKRVELVNGMSLPYSQLVLVGSIRFETTNGRVAVRLRPNSFTGRYGR